MQSERRKIEKKPIVNVIEKFQENTALRDSALRDSAPWSTFLSWKREKWQL